MEAIKKDWEIVNNSLLFNGQWEKGKVLKG